MKHMRLRSAVSAISDPSERDAWLRLLSALHAEWGHSWTSVIGGYVAVLLRGMPDPRLRRLVDLASVDPSEQPAAADALRMAWSVARSGRCPGDPPRKQYQYTVDLRLRGALRHVNPALIAAAFPERMPTGWSIWRSVVPSGGGGAQAAAKAEESVAEEDEEEEIPSPPSVGGNDGGESAAEEADEFRRLLEQCTSVVERLIVWLFATTKLPPRDVRRLRWNPSPDVGGGGSLFLVRKTVPRAVPACPEVLALIAEWRRSTMKSARGFIFPHNSRACVRVGYLTRIIGAIIGDMGDEAVSATIDRLRGGRDDGGS